MATSDRAKQGGGTERPLDPSIVAAPGQVAPGSTAYERGALGGSAGITRGTGADWFGPLDPMAPTAPPEVAGRMWDFPSGYNLTQQPRAYSPIGFPTLRALADGYDVLRIVIETRKDEMERLQWSIGPRDPKTKVTPDLEGRIKTLEKFFRRPDRVHFWGQWLRMILEDLLVIDAPTVFKRRTRAGEIYSLEVIDGATIKRVIDDWGRTPEPPVAAYQQALKGFPAVNYTTDDVLYMPRNVRAHQVYGYSPVEQIIMMINIALKREVFQLNFFTEGNMPESLIGTPETWTPDQIRQFQDWFDGMLEGDLAQRRKAKFVPSAVGKTFIQTKETELFGKAEEWIARVVCFAFSVSPQPFLNMMNRATAETAQETAATNGLVPLMNWVRDFVNTILIDEFDEHDLEFKWQEEDELDPKVESDIIKAYVDGGIISRNDARKRIGEDPLPEPEFDRPMITTGTGLIPVAPTAEEKAAEEQKKQDQLEAMKQGGFGGGKTPPSGAEADAPAQPKGNAPPMDASELNKSHDAVIKPIERAAQRSPRNNDSKVTFGVPADRATMDAVFNAAALVEPNWR